MFVRDETKNLVNPCTFLRFGGSEISYSATGDGSSIFNITIVKSFDSNIKISKTFVFEIILDDFSAYTQFVALNIENLPRFESTEGLFYRSVLMLQEADSNVAIVNINNLVGCSNDNNGGKFNFTIVNMGTPITLKSSSSLYVRIYVNMDWIVPSAS